MKSAQRWYSGRVGSESGTKEWVHFRVSGGFGPFLRGFWGMSGSKGPPCSQRKGPGGISPTVSLAWLGDVLEKLHFTLLAATVSRGSFCSSLVLSSVEQISSVCLSFPEKMRKVCACMLGHATCQLLQLVLALPLFVLQGWEFPAWLR